MKKILNNCKKFNLVRKMLVVLLVFAMTFGTFAAVVSDNDSSAFVTKAELEALKTSYEKQVKNYYDKINEKVDNTIVAYLNYWNDNGTGAVIEPYPVGSIYISVDNTDPGTLFGGAWQKKAAGQMLVGLDENDTSFNSIGKTGGEKVTTLNSNNLPAHSHTFTGTRSATTESGDHTHWWYARATGWTSSSSRHTSCVPAPYNNIGFDEFAWNHTHTLKGPAADKVTIGTYGSSSAQLNVLQPYFVVNIWERIS